MLLKSNVDGIAFLMKKNKIDVLIGTGSFVDKNTIQVKSSDGKETKITTEKVIIATGSKPTPLPFAPFDKKRIISSTEALTTYRSSHASDCDWWWRNRNGIRVRVRQVGIESYRRRIFG